MLCDSYDVWRLYLSFSCTWASQDKDGLFGPRPLFTLSVSAVASSLERSQWWNLMFRLVTGKGFREGEASRIEKRGEKGHTFETSAG